jgi:hypothetical protein
VSEPEDEPPPRGAAAPRRPSRFAITNGRALVAVLLAVAVGTAIIVLSVAAAINEGRSTTELSQQSAALLSTILGGALGAIATYLGMTHAANKRDQDDEPQ